MVYLRVSTAVIALLLSGGSALAEEPINPNSEVREQQLQKLIDDRQAAEKAIEENPLTDERRIQEGLVEVEPNNILPSDLIIKDPLVPYKVRRKDWGYDVGAAYSLFHPTNYTPHFETSGNANFESTYGDSAENKLIELYISKKYNFTFGSLGAEVGYGLYSNDGNQSDAGRTDVTLNLQLLRVGGRYVFDNLMYEPIIAPYVGGGAYIMFYKEEQASTSFNGNTDPGLYYYAGILMQLNWLDRQSAAESYVEGGIENTFIFVEMRKLMAATSNIQDPDFETDFDLSGGLSLEF